MSAKKLTIYRWLTGHTVSVFERYPYDENSYDANDEEIQAASVDHNKIVKPPKYSRNLVRYKL